jgi:hypothetical protein
MAKVMLREIAHSRAGDKGNISNISLIVYDRKYYDLVKDQVTAKRVKDFFSSISFGEVYRYECDEMGALNFVLMEALDGGNTRSLRADGFGKSLSSYLLAMEVKID